MNTRRWRQIEALYRAALRLNAEERETYLAQACGEDEALREEVLRLISADDTSDMFLEIPIFHLGMQLLSDTGFRGSSGEDAESLSLSAAQGLGGNREATAGKGYLWEVGDFIENRWEVYDVIQGGMSVVYIVYDEHPSFREPFAVKTFRDELFVLNIEMANRFTQEALAWVSLEAHPNVVQARFVKTIYGKPHLFLEYVGGGDLRNWIATGRLTKDLPQALRFAIQFCDGMIHARSRGIEAHRDIKPQNCLISADKTLKIADFGLAKVFNETGVSEWSQRRGAHSSKRIKIRDLGLGLTQTGIAAGTPTHMAPEQFDDLKGVDVRGDIYSFGVMLHQMLTSREPFAGGTWLMLEMQHKYAPPVIEENIPATLRRVIEKCLAKDPAQRFTDFHAVRQELGTIYEQLTNERAPRQATGIKLSAQQYDEKGLCLVNLGRYDEAIAYFERALALDEQLEAAWTHKGVALDELGKFYDALDCYDRALKIRPHYAPAWSHKGLTLVKMVDFKHSQQGVSRYYGNFKDAFECAKRGVDCDQQSSIAWISKGLAASKYQNNADAIYCLNHAIKLDPFNERAWLVKGQEIEGRHEDQRHKDHGREFDDCLTEALTCYGRAFELNPRFESAWVRYGALLEKLGRYEEARAVYERALWANPQHPRIWRSCGLALGMLNQDEEALDYYTRALELDPQQIQIWKDKGISLGAVGRFDEANSCFDRLLVSNPYESDAWSCKSWAMRHLGRYDEAYRYAEQSLEYNPSHVDAWRNEGYALAQGFSLYHEARTCFLIASYFACPEAYRDVLWAEEKIRELASVPASAESPYRFPVPVKHDWKESVRLDALHTIHMSPPNLAFPLKTNDDFTQEVFADVPLDYPDEGPYSYPPEGFDPPAVALKTLLVEGLITFRTERYLSLFQDRWDDIATDFTLTAKGGRYYRDSLKGSYEISRFPVYSVHAFRFQKERADQASWKRPDIW